MVGLHQQLHEHEFEQIPGVGDGQGSLVCCIPLGCKESDTTEQLNCTETKSKQAQILTTFIPKFFLHMTSLPLALIMAKHHK